MTARVVLMAPAGLALTAPAAEARVLVAAAGRDAALVDVRPRRSAVGLCDTVLADPQDAVARDCERVRR